MKFQALQILTEELLDNGLLLVTRPPIKRNSGRETLIEVGNTSYLDGDDIYQEGSPAHYLANIKQNRFSWLLFDGSIIQLTYRLKGKVITFHRYCYIPAPFDLDLRSDGEMDLPDIIETATMSDPLNTPRRTILRFEYDPVAQAANHAAAHLHMNTSECRIPLRRPISVREFVVFLISFFYSSNSTIGKVHVTNFEGSATITDAERKNFHLNWHQ